MEVGISGLQIMWLTGFDELNEAAAFFSILVTCSYCRHCVVYNITSQFISSLSLQDGPKYMVVDEKPVRDDSFLTASARDLCKHKTIFWAHPGCLNEGMTPA